MTTRKKNWFCSYTYKYCAVTSICLIDIYFVKLWKFLLGKLKTVLFYIPVIVSMYIYPSLNTKI